MDKINRMRIFLLTVYSFLAGIVSGRFYPLLPAYQPVFWVIVSLLFLIIMILFYKQNFSQKNYFLPLLKPALYLLLILFIFLLGWGRYSRSLSHLYPRHVSEIISEDFSDTRIVEGTVVQPPKIRDESVMLQISPHRVWPEDNQNDTVVVSRGDIIIQIQPYHTTEIDYEYFSGNQIYGDLLRVTGAVLEPAGQANPGGFNYREYLNNRDIYGAIWYAEKIEILEQKRGFWLKNRALGLREKIKDLLLTPENNSRTDQTGIGIVFNPLVRLGLIAVTFWLLLTPVNISAKNRSLIISLIICFYFFITALTFAYLIAAVITITALLFFGQTKTDLPRSLIIGGSTGVLIACLLVPRLIIEPIFTYQFATFLSLALITPAIDKVLKNLQGFRFVLFWVAAVITMILLIINWNFLLVWYICIPYIILWAVAFWQIKKLDSLSDGLEKIGFNQIPATIRIFISIQFALQLGVIWPLSTYYYNQFPLAGIVTNFITFPLIMIIDTFSFFTMLFNFIPLVGPSIASIFNNAYYYLNIIYYQIAALADQIFPYPAVRAPSPAQLLFLYLAIALFIYRTRGLKKSVIARA
ncbi:MAG: ComEC/Rec2 family competence protein [bacterium]